MRTGTTYLVQITYDYVETYEVFEADEETARLSYEAGLATHVDSSPPLRRRVRVVAKDSPKDTL